MPTLCGIFGVTPLVIMNGLFPKLFAYIEPLSHKIDLRKTGISVAKVQRKIRSHNSGNG